MMRFLQIKFYFCQCLFHFADLKKMNWTDCNKYLLSYGEIGVVASSLYFYFENRG